ncbi:HK97 gp10 family phage protein [Mesorhizobium sp. LHD-90]|uniref:HK97-gp10 family putative phage morphogenesis protein n=1 Tax=Mesorhizobium sp. LHD-90 TaxID=3071414 RepID=UPI0027E07BDC|nr:HK97-gp10 family putative phage morphogenesis protein [Mesorhizobium sp. LHD-90]MDQ6434385.1 HK97 gp10 family phage protein [Mesorhizobium sp. LHD-90]
MAVQGLNALNKRLARMPAAARAELEKAVVEGANRTAVLARGLAPHESGALRESIHVEAGRHQLHRLVVSGGPSTTVTARAGHGSYDYAKAQEWGTDDMDPNPSLYPAFRALKKSITARMSRAARKAAKGGGNAS